MKRKKSYQTNFFKRVFFSLIILILLIFTAEIFTRAFISLATKDLKTFQFGFNKNIKIHINHLIKLKINLIDLSEINNSLNYLNKNKNKNKNKKKDKNNKLSVWAFGGSTTKGHACGKNASSWTNELVNLNENIKIINYGQNGIDSYVSLQILQKKN